MPSWFSSVPWDAITAIATIGIATVGGWQIAAIRWQNKGWETLRVCEKYDLDPILDRALRNLKIARDSGEFAKNPLPFTLDVCTVLNYLEGIATGIKQGLYVEELARDHMEPIVNEHVLQYLSSDVLEKLRFNAKDYRRLKSLNKRWEDENKRKEDEPTLFRDGRWWFFGRRRS